MKQIAAAIVWCGTSLPVSYLILKNKHEAGLLIFCVGVGIIVFIAIIGADKE